jgi:hypothetical protein
LSKEEKQRSKTYAAVGAIKIEIVARVCWRVAIPAQIPPPG